MLATAKGVYNDGIVVLEANPNLKNGDEVIVTYELSTLKAEKEDKEEWGFVKCSEYFRKNHPGLVLSDAVIEERENYR